MDFLDLLFPKHCCCCGKFGTYLCDGCRISQPLHFPQVCPKCERPAVDGRTHPGCQTPWALDGATFIFRYQKPIAQLLKQLKYRFGRDLSNLIVRWSMEELKKLSVPKSAILLPIPLHPWRDNWRGFNQAEILGQEIAHNMGWDFRNDILVRTKFRKPQTEVKESKKRRVNVRGVFSISPNAPITQLPSNLILFDDVWTTGATIKEAGKVLKRRGAKFVWALAIAR